tara:strand:+ start:375 stop:524 length:150 start_codon:yes stop_codon:yes gene_type:complete
MTSGFEDFDESGGGTIMEEMVALADAVEGRRVEFLDSGFVVEADVVFVG